ncbi:MAG: hypothetical protein HYR91_07065 [Flavobacteriia bacterium]|nr:hypothetical protein [Flavobacteriia bacterium]
MTRQTTILLVTIFLLFGQEINAQTITQTKDSSVLTIKAIDVVEMTNLTDYTLTISNPYDTLIFSSGAYYELFFQLDSLQVHRVTISKSGYTTLNVTWKYPNDSAHVLVEFYMLKEKLTKEEKRQAHKHSYNICIENVPPHNGGFELIVPRKNEVFVAMVKVFSNGISTQYETSTEDEIIGNYCCHYTLDGNDQIKKELIIKNGFEYTKIITVEDKNGKNKSKITGTWVLKNDTIILTPTTYKSKTTCNCLNEKNNIWCKSETLVYLDNELWITQPSYKKYLRK